MSDEQEKVLDPTGEDSDSGSGASPDSAGETPAETPTDGVDKSVLDDDGESTHPAEEAGESEIARGTEDASVTEASFDVQPATFPPLDPPAEPSLVVEDLEFLKDVDLDVTVELGRAEMSLQDVLGLAHGVVIELDKLAGEPVDILVNGKLVGRGEVVVIEAMFGVRVTDIIPPDQRWKYR